MPSSTSARRLAIAQIESTIMSPCECSIYPFAIVRSDVEIILEPALAHDIDRPLPMFREDIQIQVLRIATYAGINAQKVHLQGKRDLLSSRLDRARICNDFQCSGAIRDSQSCRGIL